MGKGIDLDGYLDKVSSSETRFSGLKDKIPEKKLVHVKKGNLFKKLKNKLFPPKETEYVDKDAVMKDVEESKVKEPKKEEEEKPKAESEVEETENIEDPEKSKSIFETFLSFFRGDSKEEPEDTEEEDEQPQDMKNLAVITKDIIERLPKKEFKKLKEEGKIDEYKDILNRNNLIKQ